MIYYKDKLQLNQINKITVKMLEDFKKSPNYDKLLIEYKKEINYWTNEYPSQILGWEDDGGFYSRKS